MFNPINPDNLDYSNKLHLQVRSVVYNSLAKDDTGVAGYLFAVEGIRSLIALYPNEKNEILSWVTNLINDSYNDGSNK